MKAANTLCVTLNCLKKCMCLILSGGRELLAALAVLIDDLVRGVLVFATIFLATPTLYFFCFPVWFACEI